MTAQRTIARVVRRRIRSERCRKLLGTAETTFELVRNGASNLLPQLIGASPRNLTLAITAKCNLRCVGCRYGRDYMTGHELPLPVVIRLLRDSAEAGISTVRLYGGEPTLHPGLPRMVAEAVGRGITPFVTTNGQNLETRLGPLFEAGLRVITLGYYGSDEVYDNYVGRRGAWNRFERSIAAARERYGSAFELHISYVLNTRTCSSEQLDRAWALALRYALHFHIDLVHYSLPYFSEGPDRELQFTAADAPRIRAFVDHLTALKHHRPDLYPESSASIRSIPDWLLKGPGMRVPCDAYDMIWVGADGSVRLCFAAFPLGNLHDRPLSAILFTPEHRAAALGAVRLDCPNCHCRRESRIAKHLPSLLRYTFGKTAVGVTVPPDDSLFPILGQNV